MKSVIACHSVKLTDGDAAYRVAAWQELMSTSGAVDVTAGQAERFMSESCFRRLGPALVGRVQVTDCRLVRSAAAVERIGLDNVFVIVLEAGSVDGTCGHRRMQASAGSACVTLLSSPVDFAFRDLTWTAIIVSRKLLECETGPLAPYDGRVFAPGSLRAVVLDAHIRAMLALPDPLPSAEASVAGRSCLAVLAALFGASEKAAEATPAPDQQLANSVRSHILSRSRLYRAMRSNQDIAGEIRRLRLAGAHRDIASRESTDVPIAVIARRWGFGQDRTFRRAFQLAFGCSPASLRAQAASDRTPVLPSTGHVIEGWFKDL